MNYFFETILLLVLIVLALGYVGRGDYELALEKENAQLKTECRLAQAMSTEQR